MKKLHFLFLAILSLTAVRAQEQIPPQRVPQENYISFKTDLRRDVTEAFYAAFQYPASVLDTSAVARKQKKNRDGWRNVWNYEYGKESFEGRVTVLYSVYRFGKLSRPVVVKGLSPEIDKAVLKAMKQVCSKVTADKKYNDTEYIQTFYITPDGSRKTVIDADETVLLNPEEPSIPEGGRDGLTDFVAKNQRYPERAAESGAQGTIETNFVIDEEGYVLAGCVYSTDCADLDCAALKLVAKIPQMTPAIHKGTQVKSFWTWPIVYKLTR